MDIYELKAQLDRIEKIVRTNKKVLSLEEAAEYTGISRSYLYKLTAKNEIPFSKPNGKKIFFSKDKLDAWLLTNPSKSKKEIYKEALNYTFKNKRR